MHNALHAWFQIAVFCEVLIQSIRNINFIIWQGASYLTVYKVLTYNEEFCPL